MSKRPHHSTRRSSLPLTLPAGVVQVGGVVRHEEDNGQPGAKLLEKPFGLGFDLEEAQRIEGWLRDLRLREDDLRDPHRARYRVARDPRSILASLCNSLALVLVGASTELAELEAEARRRVAWRKEKRWYLNTIKKLQARGCYASAEELAQKVKQGDAAHRQDLRRAKKEIRDNLLCQCRDLIELYTQLRGDRAWKKLSDILGIIEPDLSEDCRALKGRFERIPADMRRNWKQRHSA